MAITLSGNSISYTFPDTFDLKEIEEPANVKGQKVIGRDGVVIDSNALSKQPMKLRISGYIKGTSVSDAWSKYDDLKQAVDASVASGNDAMLLSVDGVKTAYVRKESMTTERMGGKVIKVSIRFVVPSGDWE